MKLILFYAFFIASCSGGRHHIERKAVTPSPQKKHAGKLTLTDLTDTQLADLHIIPENGKVLMKARNTTFTQVDGIWSNSSPVDQWFKIPDFSQAWIGKAPERFDGVVERYDLKIYYKTNPLIKMAGFKKNGVNGPSWVPDQSETRSPVGRP